MSDVPLRCAHTMASSDGWISRKRPRKDAGGGIGSKGGAKEDNGGGKLPASAPQPATSDVPASLLPFLGWTKLSACHRPRARRRQRSNWDREEGVQKVTGLAVVSLLMICAYDVRFANR